MKRFSRLLQYILPAALLCALVPGRPLAASEKGTIVVVSFDGMKNDYVHEHKKELPHLNKIMKHGFDAKDITAVYPSLTAASHASIATGAKPEKTGLVSNAFHNKNFKLTDTEDAFWSALDVPAIWSEGRKHGKVTATICFPGSNPEVSKAHADYAIYYKDTFAKSDLVHLTFRPAKGWNNAPKSRKPLKEAVYRLKLKGAKNRTIHVLAAALHHDAYDLFYFSDNKTIEDKDARVGVNQWGSFTLNENHQPAGFWFKMKKTDRTLSKAEMYRTAVTSAAIKGPGDFAKTINSLFGFFPVDEDLAAFKKGWITRTEYEDISTRFAQWVQNVSLFIKDRYKPDLLMFYEPQIDHEEHAYLSTDPRQPGYSDKKAKTYAARVRWAYQLADHTVGKTLQSLGENDKLFVVSDHGMEPMHTGLSPNYELKKHGLLVLKKNGEIDLNRTKAYAVASGTMAHVYINLKGSEKGGIVSKQDYGNVQQEVAKIFSSVRDPRILASKSKLAGFYLSDWWQGITNGHSSWSTTKETISSLYDTVKNDPARPYESVIKAQSKKSEWFHHPHAGDVTLVAARGYMMDSDISSSFHAPSELRNHGGNPERSDLRPVLLAYGKDIPHKKVSRRLSLIDIAPTLYRMMNVPAPFFVDGKEIKELVP
ncbi:MULTISPECIES: alkaline phosphatase family protein [Heyndrickxia]|uniref:Type I phosphodiesterase/nucleotide pyrophosphatase n=2 Tax=Heyndrickxia TaxID=2837504 RepID=G2TI68_HEYCO|nr:alkaline phosphatase family protein [Heyndrickxia coagulans]AEP00343.1 type I phosphodiesterase/nucleotide pyrophosphatase [Heyndrickxia coagulans 36D1]AWP35677.1 nucleotide pyrophosphatase [Heyndrickxia coagulans]QDI61174.1 nucleotide pyrophosphatase [Heyndrickxia coagulans]